MRVCATAIHVRTRTRSHICTHARTHAFTLAHAQTLAHMLHTNAHAHTRAHLQTQPRTHPPTHSRARTLLCLAHDHPGTPDTGASAAHTSSGDEGQPTTTKKSTLAWRRTHAPTRAREPYRTLITRPAHTACALTLSAFETHSSFATLSRETRHRGQRSAHIEWGRGAATHEKGQNSANPHRYGIAGISVWESDDCLQRSEFGLTDPLPLPLLDLRVPLWAMWNSGTRNHRNPQIRGKSPDRSPYIFQWDPELSDSRNSKIQNFRNFKLCIRDSVDFRPYIFLSNPALRDQFPYMLIVEWNADRSIQTRTAVDYLEHVSAKVSVVEICYSKFLLGLICSVHSNSKNLEGSAETFATVEKRHIAFGRQHPKPSNGHEKSRYLVEKS